MLSVSLYTNTWTVFLTFLYFTSFFLLYFPMARVNLKISDNFHIFSSLFISPIYDLLLLDAKNKFTHLALRKMSNISCMNEIYIFFSSSARNFIQFWRLCWLEICMKKPLFSVFISFSIAMSNTTRVSRSRLVNELGVLWGVVHDKGWFCSWLIDDKHRYVSRIWRLIKWLHHFISSKISSNWYPPLASDNEQRKGSQENVRTSKRGSWIKWFMKKLNMT